MKKLALIAMAFLGFQSLSAQETTTRKDTLQGGLRAERTCYDVLRYDLNIKINIQDKSIVGYNDISFKVVSNTKKIQVDLFDNMQVDSIVFHSKKLEYKREFNAVFIDFPTNLNSGNEEKIRFYYSGKPIVTNHSPIDKKFNLDRIRV